MIYRQILQSKFRVLGGLALSVFVSAVAEAHPGHGSSKSVDNGHTLIHYLTEPYHMVGILGTAAVIVACS